MSQSAFVRFFHSSRFLLKLFLSGCVAAAMILVYLDAWILSEFSGSRFHEPAKVYARPLDLFVGKEVSEQQLRYELEALNYRWVQQVRVPGDAQREKRGQEIRFRLHSRDFEFEQGFRAGRYAEVRIRNKRVQVLQDRSGKAIARMRLEPQEIGSVSSGAYEDRDLVGLETVPETTIKALIAVEDRSFTEHWGVSLRGILRALLSNVKAGSMSQGGSTLTQQLVKNFFLTQDRTLLRKLIELPMAVLLELRFSKEDILEAYINEVFLGQRGTRAIHGFNLAAKEYFGRELRNTSLAQQATLVGMVKGASYYNPQRHPERVTKRRDLVLDLMFNEGFIDAEEAAAAKREALLLSSKPLLSQEGLPAFMGLVRRQVQSTMQWERGELNDLSGLRIFSTLDPFMQYQAEQALSTSLQQLETRHELEPGFLQGALVAVRPGSGEVLAMVGDRNPRYAGFNRALDAYRPIGSLVKPALYLAALESREYTLASPLDDSQLQLRADDGSVWSPRNFDNESHGEVLLTDALQHSYNQAAARLGLELGIDTIIQTLNKLGIHRELPRVPALSLGAASLSPFEVAGFYATLADAGHATQLRSIKALHTEDGEFSHFSSASSPRFNEANVYLLQTALQGATRSGTAKSLRSLLPARLPVAGKTGTSNDLRDSWFAGFSGDLLAVAWVGTDNNAKTPLTGASGALPVWARFMGSASYRGLQLQAPPEVTELWVDSGGRLSAEGCEGARKLPFVRGVEPQIDSDCGARETDTIWDWFKGIFRSKG